MNHRVKWTVVGVLAASCVLLSILAVQGSTVEKMNVTRLINHGELIVVGTVMDLTDGFDANGLPYTDVTVFISQTLRGNANGNYTFRQFGLLAPRDVGNGRTYLGISPDGFPKFAVGQEVMLFLYQTTALGFQSTVGLLQGKFNISDGQASNPIDNLELFKDATVDLGMLTPDEQKMLSTERGPVRKDTFVSFVTKAVENGWY